MRNALTIALQSYSGALILVSHDRYLLQTTTDELFFSCKSASQIIRWRFR